MLQFFRKHQKFLFLFVTIIIVITFVFFGSYQAFAPSFSRKQEKDEVLFKTINGRKIKSSYLNEMTAFLTREDWMGGNKIFNINFLNDGVISQDILQTNLSQLIAENFSDTFIKKMNGHLEKERNYSTYAHPCIPQLDAMSIWSIFSPEMHNKIENLKKNATFQARVDLFLTEKAFPPGFFSQVVRYQEKEYPKSAHDPRLQREDISLFGYHHLADWFGEDFVSLMAQVIIHCAAKAEKEGHYVSKDEVLCELIGKSQKVYEVLKERVSLPVEDGYGFFQLYLQQTGMSEATVVKIWQDVTLFRRLLGEISSGLPIDPLTFEQFYSYAHENATVTLYQMNEDFRFQTFDELKNFEAYIEAVGEARKSPLDLPVAYKAITAIEKKTPELVGKRFQLYVAAVDKEQLSNKITVKETWDWACNPAHWELLKNNFPILGQKTGSVCDILEQVDPKIRKRIDVFVNDQIASKHPEWIQEALNDTIPQKRELFLNDCAEKSLPGIVEGSRLATLLDKEEELSSYTQDNKHYYRFLVIERPNDKEILTFVEAKKRGLLKELAEKLGGDTLAEKVCSALNLEKELSGPHRFRQYLTNYQKNKSQYEDSPLADQWQIQKKLQTITRMESTFLPIENILKGEAAASFDVLVDKEQGAYFVEIVDQKRDRVLPASKMFVAQQFIAQEACFHYFTSLFKEIKEKNALYHLPESDV